MISSFQFFSTIRSRKLLLIALAFIALTIFFSMAKLVSSPDTTMLPVAITGVHHMGEKFAVSEFYINRYWGGNIGPEGGGGSTVCCAMLPEKWRPGLVGDVRWSVSDWSKKNKEQVAAGDYSSVDWKMFRAIVPVEKYEGHPEQLYVHFFVDGGVRVISSGVGSENKNHPIRDTDPSAGSIATRGTATDSLFTDLEFNNMMNEKKRQGSGRQR